MKLSSPDLAIELGIKVLSIHQRRYKYGHAYGYKPCGYELGTKTYLWEKL